MDLTRPMQYEGKDNFVDDRSTSSSSSFHNDRNKIIDELQPYRDQTVVPIVKSAAEKRLVRRINLALLPFIGAIMFIQFVDKTTIATSAVLGLIEDTHLTGTQYSWLGSFFSLGYICFQLPNSYLIQKLPVGKYMGSLLVLWGIVMGCTALCHTFAQLAAARTLLGFFEAGTFPCVLIIINTIYRRSELPAAYCFMHASAGLANMVGAVCAYGISFIDNARGVHTWRWLYIVWGSVTVLIGILTFCFMPDNPQSLNFQLTEEEKKIIVERTNDNGVVRVRKIKEYQIWEALREVRLWLVFLSAFISWMEAVGINVFSTLLVKSLGFSGPQAILFQIAGGGAHIFFNLMPVYIARKSGQLYFAATAQTIVALVGCILLAALPNTSVKLVGFLLSFAGPGIAVIIVTIVGANVVGYTKKIFYNTVYTTAFTLGNFVGPLVMLEKEAPVYKTGMIIYCIGMAAILIMLFIMRQIMARQNKIRLQNPLEKVVDVNEDYTDRENKSFIYKL